MKKSLVCILLMLMIALACATAYATGLRPPPGSDNLVCVNHNWVQVGVLTPTCTQKGAYYLECSNCGKQKTEERPATGEHTWAQIGFDDATCTEMGYFVLECTGCGQTTREEAARPLGHNWKGAFSQAATCSAEGYTEYICLNSGCSETKKETIPKLEHHFELYESHEPTCGWNGLYRYICTNCATFKEEKPEATGKHTYENGGTVLPSCWGPGSQTYTCSVCAHTYKEVLPQLEHVWKVAAETPATCVADGERRRRCNECGYEEFDTLKATGQHTWEVTYSEPATCAADGYKSYKCKHCSETKIETLPATGNCSWGNWITVTEASCNQDGLKVAECTVCGDTKKETIPSEGVHDYRTTSTKAATCEEDGSKNYTCSKCGKTKKETLKATGHSWQTSQVTKAATCTQDGTAETECSVCGKKETQTVQKLGHSWGEWKVTKEATAKAEGTKERTCKTCSAKETESIPKKGTKPTATPKPEETKKPVSETNKTSNSKKNSANMEAADGVVEVFTTAGSVNMRSGPGRSNKRVQQVAKRYTCLGELLDAQVDSKGTVWFQVEYKNKTCWVTSDYAKAVVGELDGDFRAVDGETKEVTSFYLKSMSEAAELLGLEENGDSEAYSAGYSDGTIFVSGNDYAERIELTGEGYTIYGIEIGDKIKDVQKKLKKANLAKGKADDMYEGAYVYHVVCSPDSLVINDKGFDGQMIIYVDSKYKVEMMILQAYTE